jgi:hypothetical protein
VRPVVVGLDVGADLRSGFVDGLELFAPDAALFELAEPRLDERLALGVAVAAAAVRDAVLAEPRSESAARERLAVAGAESE